jgi:ABC-type sugar transport system ATPase subunit
MHKLSFRHVSVTLGRKKILEDISLDACSDLLIIGRSGAGKSTLLKALAGLIPMEGSIELDGRDIGTLKPDQRGMAMIFQKAALFPHVRVKENITYGLKALGWPKQRMEAEVNEMAQLLQIEDLLHRYPGTLSGGEAQRVDIARALIRHPSVLLMDEPFSSLDHQLADDLRRQLKAILEQKDIMPVIVSHDQRDAAAFTGTILYLKEGRREEAGPAARLYEEPEHLSTASFYGEPPMNLIGAETEMGRKILHGMKISEEVKTIAFRPQWIRKGNEVKLKVCSCQPWLDRYDVSAEGGIHLLADQPVRDEISFDITRLLFYDGEGRLTGTHPDEK